MKHSNLLFTLAVCAFLIIVFVAMQFAPQKFSWQESYSPTDPQPFGTLLFDSLMHESMPKGYEIKYESISHFAKHDTLSRRSVLCIYARDHYLSNDEVNSLLQMAARGDRVMLVSQNLSELCDTLNFTSEYSTFFNYTYVKEQLRELGYVAYDTLYLPRRSGYATHRLPIIAAMRGSLLKCDSLRYNYDVLATLQSWKNPKDESQEQETLEKKSPVAIKVHWGRGYLYLITLPLCFTNYGVLDANSRTFVLRMMNELKRYPVTHLCDESVQNDGTDNYGALQFFVSKPPLRFAWQLLVVGAVLLLIINARRRQRAIPLWGKSVNATIDLLTQHASLYRKRTDHAPLLMRKYRAYAAEMQKSWRVDVENTSPTVRQEQVQRLARYLGRSAESVHHDLSQLDYFRFVELKITPQMFRQAMELMRKLTPDKQNP